jgi:predicted dehydrogenase
MGNALRVGLVGTGFIGGVHARSIAAAGADLVAVASSTPARAQSAALRLGAGRAVDKGLDLVTAGDIDVVHIAAPNDLHAELTLAALEAGKHVVCEKPLATTVADASRMCALAQARGLVGAVPFVNRFHPMAREARVLVASGSYGAVHTVHGSYLQDWLLDPDATNWRVDAVRGGPSRAFADIGSHWVDLAEWITGDRIVELVATTSINVADRPVGERETFSTEPTGPDADRAAATTEDTACVVFRTDGGASGTLTVSQVAAGRKNRLWIEVDAQRNSITFDQEDAEHLLIGDGTGTRTLARDPIQLSSAARPYAVLPAGHPQGFQDCFDAFVRDVYRSIGDGAPVDGLPTFEDGLRSARVVDAVLASTRKHSWIEV